MRDVAGTDEPVPAARVPADWYRRRAVGRLRLAPGQRWPDLRSPATREALRGELAAELLRLGMADLDLSGVAGPSRALTQAIAGWAHEQEYAGLVYASRLDQRLICWAVFEGAHFEPVGLPEPITPEDPDLRAAARLFGLALWAAPRADDAGTPYLPPLDGRFDLRLIAQRTFRAGVVYLAYGVSPRSPDTPLSGSRARTAAATAT